MVDKLDEPITEPLVVNGQSYITAEAVEHAVADAKANDSTVPLGRVILNFHLARHNSSIDQLVEDLGVKDARQMQGDLPKCIDYLDDVLSAIKQRWGIREVTNG